MIHNSLPALLLLSILANTGLAQENWGKDIISTSEGDLEITFLGHGTLMFTFDDKVIHVDPFSRVADYNDLPKADVILVTHHHFDHFDSKLIDILRKKSTTVVLTQGCAQRLKGDMVMANGEFTTVQDIPVEAHPAYNLVHKREDGSPFHPKGEGNSYVVTFGDVRVYIGGDTENIPEMKDLQSIDIAFLPMNLPYTMTPEMVADASRMIRLGILYPYHTGDTDVAQLQELLKDEKGIEIRIREMK
ncbi:MBL fold metallo-hydrolase [Candidatus Neomarinimicrobiota bacterium]